MISFLLIARKDNSNKIEHVPLMIALSNGKYIANAGKCSGRGSIFLFKIITATKTIIESVSTQRKTVFSFTLFNESIFEIIFFRYVKSNNILLAKIYESDFISIENKF